MSIETAPLTPAHHDLIRLLADQAAQEWLRRQQSSETAPQKKEGAGRDATPPAPDMPDL